jgi:hypothetical protein
MATSDEPASGEQPARPGDGTVMSRSQVSVRSPGSPYSEACDREGRALDARLAQIRRRVGSGEYGIREAADERIRCLTQHLAELERLRTRYLGDDAPVPEPDQVTEIQKLLEPRGWDERD